MKIKTYSIVFPSVLIRALLRLHSVETMEINGEVWALEECSYFFAMARLNTDEWVKVTRWNKSQILEWLGY